MIEGWYAFRFGGFAMDIEDVPHHIVGVGFMEMNDGQISGSQVSSITALQGPGSKLASATFKLSGTYKLGADGTGEADVTFKSDKQTLRGSFAFVTAGGDDRLWLISTGAEIVSSAGIAANEVVAGEAVRTPTP